MVIFNSFLLVYQRVWEVWRTKHRFLGVSFPTQVVKFEDLREVDSTHRFSHRFNGDWLVVWNMNLMTFHLLGRIIIPTDELIFFRGLETTNEHVMCFFSHLPGEGLYWFYIDSLFLPPSFLVLISASLPLWRMPGPELMPERMPEITPDRISDRIPDKMLEYMSDRMPERLPGRMNARKNVRIDARKYVRIDAR